MSRYIIYSSYEDAFYRERQIFNQINPTDNHTIAYAELITHPAQNGKTALIIEQNYKQYFTQDEINNSVILSEDWFI